MLQFDENIFRMYCSKQARRQDSVTGGGGGGTRSLIVLIQGGTRSLFEYGSNEKGEDQKKGLRPKIFTNSGYRLKILAVFHEI